jgi:oligopeptide/dipeptide ABC transporter ATP-binding protein
MSEDILSIEDLKTYFETGKGTVRAIDGVTLKVRKAEFIALVGESGSGKTTLGLSIIRLLPPPGRIVSGAIVFDGRNLVQLKEEEMVRLRGFRIGMVFQDPMTSLDPLSTVGSHVQETITAHEKITKDEASKRVAGLLDSVGVMPGRSKDYPHQFSGGMRQRIMIASAIALNPALLIADEPTTSLDVIVQAQVLDLLERLRDQFRMAVMLITHDLSLVLSRCDRIVVMYAGKVVELADSLELARNPLHPYTIGLLRSIPNIELEDQKIEYLEGSPPDLINPPTGCRFHTRCPRAMEVCQVRDPGVIEVSPGHLVACFLCGDAP